MLSQVVAMGYLDHETAVYEIQRRFGGAFLYENDRGNQAVDRRVLKAFRIRLQGSGRSGREQ